MLNQNNHGPTDWTYGDSNQPIPAWHYSVAPTLPSVPDDQRQYEYGNAGKRVTAWFLDTLLIWIVLVAIGLAMSRESLINAAMKYSIDGEGASIAVMATLTAYVIVGNALGGTAGKRMVGMRTTNFQGENPGFSAAIIRSWPLVFMLLINLALALPVILGNRERNVNMDAIGYVAVTIQVIWMLGCLLVFKDHHRQALHDKLAGTYVIRT